MRLYIARAFVAATAFLGFASSSFAYYFSMSISHSYRDFVDHGNVTINIYLDARLKIDCSVPVAVAQTGKRIMVTMRQVTPDPTDPAQCGGATTVLSPLAAGDYEITAQVISATGVTVESATQPLRIFPLEGRCNADPLARIALLALHKTLSAARFANLLATDPAYAARLGNPTVLNKLGTLENRTYAQIIYPPLVDVTVEYDRLLASGEFNDVDAIAAFVEFYNAKLDHYFYSGDAAEVATIAAGGVGPGWMRTGKSFRAIVYPGCPFSHNNTVVYRFFGIPGVGPNTHFFTRDRTECGIVDRSKQWLFEGVAFWASEPNGDGTCTASIGDARIPLYRVWRAFGDSNHRFTTDRAVVSEMVDKGWVDEGAAMCVLPPA